MTPERLKEIKAEEKVQVMESPLVTLTRDNDKLRADNEALRAMLKRITKVESWEYDLMTEKVETSTYSFEEVWHMGERRARYAQKLAEDKAASLRTQLEQAQKENENLRAKFKEADERHVVFMVKGGPVVMESEYEKLKAELKQMAEALEKSAILIAGLHQSVQWELAPSIRTEIAVLTELNLKALKLYREGKASS